MQVQSPSVSALLISSIVFGMGLSCAGSALAAPTPAPVNRSNVAITKSVADVGQKSTVYTVKDCEADHGILTTDRKGCFLPSHVLIPVGTAVRGLRRLVSVRDYEN